MEIWKNSDTVTSTTNLLDFTLKVEVERLIKQKYDIQKNRYKGVYRNLSLLEEMSLSLKTVLQFKGWDCQSNWSASNLWGCVFGLIC
jgi:hypothetical protein